MPAYFSNVLTQRLGASTQQLQVLQSFSLLIFAATLSMLATLNFSQAFVVGVVAAPLSFARPLPKLSQPLLTAAIAVPSIILWTAVSPPVMLYAVTWLWKLEVRWLLVEMAKGWVAQGVWTGVVIWGLWWPAWVVGGISLFSGVFKQ